MKSSNPWPKKPRPRPLPKSIDAKTLKEARQEARAKLLAEGMPEDIAGLEADLLLACALGKNRTYLLAHPERLIQPLQVARLESFVVRRQAKEPMAYILGEKEFFGLPLAVGPGALIPRPETEHLVEAVLEALPPHFSGAIADLGTGSGAVALALAKAHPKACVVGVDLSWEALSWARENQKRLGIAHVRWVRGLWAEALQGFDLIAANPPYLAQDDPHLSDLAFEPRGALVSGKTGLEAFSAIASCAWRALLPQGMLVLEHGIGQEKAVQDILQNAGFSGIEEKPDLSGIPRITKATKAFGKDKR